MKARMKNRGQVFTWDLVFSTILFLVLLLSLIFVWDNALADIRLQEEDYEMNWLSKTVTKTLVMTPGVPVEWNFNNVLVYGLAKTVKRGDTISTLSHVIDPNKFIYFVYDATGDYEKTRRKLLSSSRYHYYVEVSCLNDSGVDCFQGIRFESINFNIGCSNQYVFTVTDHVTDTYRWLEAEDKWGDPWGEDCTEANNNCSNSFSSRVGLSPGGKKAETNPGYYRVWVRCLQDLNGLTVVVDGHETPVGCNAGTNKFSWSSFGYFNMTRDTMIEFNRTISPPSPNPTQVDAILLTTNLNYDPATANTLYYGNPNIIKKCILGNYSGNAKKAVASSQTASFGEQLSDMQLLSGSQPYLQNTVEIRTVLWKTGD